MAEKEEEPTRVCGQCLKTVAASNFALHESHCQRFLCLCPVCKEPVPRKLLEKHGEEEHAQVKCPNCKQKMERCKLLDHESECEARLQCCEFCQLELPLSAMAKHSEACGSRTERCSDCGRYITLRDQGNHAQICPDLYGPQNSTPPFTNTESRGDNKSFPLEEIEEKQVAPTSEVVEQPSPGLTRSLKSASFSTKSWRLENKDMDQIRACPYCHLVLPVSTLRWHEAKCQIYVFFK